MESNEEKLEQIVKSVVDTLKFHGAEIKEMTISRKGIPCFKIRVSQKGVKKSLQDTLDLVYWTLWTLLYGKYDESKKDLVVGLDYEEVE